jgi:hypothetical protein
MARLQLEVQALQEKLQTNVKDLTVEVWDIQTQS